MSFHCGKPRFAGTESQGTGVTEGTIIAEHDEPQDDPRTALADVDRASRAMAASSDPPRTFMLAAVAITATVFTLIDRVPWPASLGLLALFLPLVLWYVLVMRNRPRPRHSLWPSGAYAGYLLLFLLVLHVTGWWHPHSWAGAGMKWLVLFAACWFCVRRLGVVAARDRLREAHEQHT